MFVLTGAVTLAVMWVVCQHGVSSIWFAIGHGAAVGVMAGLSRRTSGGRVVLTVARAAALTGGAVLLSEAFVSLVLPSSGELAVRGTDTASLPVWTVLGWLPWSIVFAWVGGWAAAAARWLLPCLKPTAIRVVSASTATALLLVAAYAGFAWSAASARVLGRAQIPDRPPIGWWAVPDDALAGGVGEITLCRWGVLTRSPTVTIRPFDEALLPEPGGGVTEAGVFGALGVLRLWRDDPRRGILGSQESGLDVSLFAPKGESQARETAGEIAEWLEGYDLGRQ